MPTTVTQFSASDPRFTNLAAAFGGTSSSTFTDFLKIVNASPAYIQQLNSYFSEHPDGILTSASLGPIGSNGEALVAAGTTDPNTRAITVSTSSASNDLVSTAGYKLAVTVAHELGHANDPDILSDGVVSEARAEINAYSLMQPAVNTLIASGNNLSTQGLDPLFRVDQATGQPISPLSSFLDSQNIIKSFLGSSDVGNLTSTCGAASACEAAVAITLQNNEYVNYYPNSGSAPQLLGENNGYQLVTDLANPNSIKVLDAQTGVVVQTINISASDAGLLNYSITDFTSGDTLGVIGGQGGTLDLSNSRIIIETGAQATIAGNNNTINAGANADLELAGQSIGDIISAAAGTTVVVDDGTQCVISNASTITAGSNTDITVQGNNTVVSAGNNSTVDISNNSNNDVVTMGAAGLVSVADGDHGTVVNASQGTVNFGSGNSGTLNGNDNVINSGTNDTVSIYGADNVLDAGTGNAVYDAGMSNTLNIDSSVNIEVASGQLVTVNGSDNLINSGTNDTVSIYGADNVLDAGTGNAVYDAGMSNTLNIDSSVNIEVASGQLVTVNGSDNLINSGTNDTVSIYGADNVLDAGTGNAVYDDGMNNILDLNSSVSIEVADGQTVTVNGNGNQIITNTNDTLALYGADNILDAGIGNAVYDDGMNNVFNINSSVDIEVADGQTLTVDGNGNLINTNTNDTLAINGAYNFLDGGVGNEIYDGGMYNTLDIDSSVGIIIPDGQLATVIGTGNIISAGNYDTVQVDGSSNILYGGTGDAIDIEGSYDAVYGGALDTINVYGQYDGIVDPYTNANAIFNGDDWGDAADGVLAPYESEGSIWEEDPIILNLQGQNVDTQGLSGSIASFDMRSNGQSVKTAWATAGEGMLVFDALGSDTSITQESQLVAGFDALRGMDGNGDGKLDSSDSGWSKLKVWIDASGNGDFQDGDLQTLDQLGISGIDLNASQINQDSHGNVIQYASTFDWKNGTTGAIASVDLAFSVGQTNAIPVSARAELNQLIQAMSSFAPPAGAQSCIAAANDLQLAVPLLGTGH